MESKMSLQTREKVAIIGLAIAGALYWGASVKEPTASIATPIASQRETACRILANATDNSGFMRDGCRAIRQATLDRMNGNKEAASLICTIIVLKADALKRGLDPKDEETSFPKDVME